MSKFYNINKLNNIEYNFRLLPNGSGKTYYESNKNWKYIKAEVKRILDIDNSDLMELLETTSKKEFYRLTLDHELVVRLYNCITNLQEEVEDLRRIFGVWNNRKLIKKFNKEYDKERLDKFYKLNTKLEELEKEYNNYKKH